MLSSRGFALLCVLLGEVQCNISGHIGNERGIGKVKLVSAFGLAIRMRGGVVVENW